MNTIAANNELNKPNIPVNNEPIKTNINTSFNRTNQLNQKSKTFIQIISFRSFLYVYPKSLKYEQQKMFSKARNILIKESIIIRENGSNSADETSCLKPILKLNRNFLTNNEENIFATNHQTQITHHNKTPQFYDEIKILLPLNLNEKHHLLFKFYHVSFSNAKSITAIKSDELTITNESINYSKSVETLIGYAWLPLFKNGRLINGEKQLPVAQTITSSYLTFEQTGFGQSVGPSDIKWIDGMKPLFKVNLIPLSTIHTTDVFNC